MWGLNTMRPTARATAIKKKKSILNQSSWPLLTSPLEGTPAALSEAVTQPTGLQLLCPIPPEKHQGLRLLHGSPKMCVIWRQGSQKDVILETIISFTSALSPRQTLYPCTVLLREVGGCKVHQLGFEPFEQIGDSEALPFCTAFFSAESRLPCPCQLPQSHRLSGWHGALRKS